MIYFLLILLVITYLFVRLFQNWRPDPWPQNTFKLPKWQIHRGYWVDGLQENTLPAFRETKKQGFNMIELDVQLSKDNQVIVFHDDNLKRLGNRNEKVIEVEANDLKKLANIPTLEEVLLDPEVTPYINIEVKNRSAKDQTIAYKVAEVVQRHNMQNRIIFSSFNPLSLRTLWKLLPEVPRALLVTNDKSDPDSHIYLRKMWFGGIAHANMVNLDKKMLNPSLIKRLKERNIPIAVWTVNDKTLADIFFEKGIQSIISDNPNL